MDFVKKLAKILVSCPVIIIAFVLAVFHFTLFNNQQRISNSVEAFKMILFKNDDILFFSNDLLCNFLIFGFCFVALLIELYIIISSYELSYHKKNFEEKIFRLINILLLMIEYAFFIKYFCVILMYYNLSLLDIQDKLLSEIKPSHEKAVKICFVPIIINQVIFWFRKHKRLKMKQHIMRSPKK